MDPGDTECIYDTVQLPTILTTPRYLHIVLLKLDSENHRNSSDNLL